MRTRKVARAPRESARGPLFGYRFSLRTYLGEVGVGVDDENGGGDVLLVLAHEPVLVEVVQVGEVLQGNHLMKKSKNYAEFRDTGIFKGRGTALNIRMTEGIKVRRKVSSPLSYSNRTII